MLHTRSRLLEMELAHMNDAMTNYPFISKSMSAVVVTPSVVAGVYYVHCYSLLLTWLILKSKVTCKRRNHHQRATRASTGS